MKYKADITTVFGRAACSLIAVMVAFVSCQDERMVMDVASGSDVLAFDVVNCDFHHRPVPNNPVDTLSEETVTRGTPVTTQNLGQLYPTFVVNAKEVANNDDFIFSMTNVDVSYDAAQTPRWNTANIYYWPQMEAHDVDFWCYSPKTLTGYGGVRSTPVVDFADGNITFDYEMVHGQTVSDKPADAVNQPDLLFAHQAWDRDKGPVKIHFYHALSALRFVAGVVDQCTINSITLTDVVTKASCIFAPATASADMFQWTLSTVDTDKNDIEQSFEVALAPNEDATVKQDVTDAGGRVERTFMVIPQDFQQIKVCVNYKFNGMHDSIAEFLLPELSATQPSRPTVWLPGKIYTYVIHAIHNVSISPQVSVDPLDDGGTYEVNFDE